MNKMCKVENVEVSNIWSVSNISARGDIKQLLDEVETRGFDNS